MYVVNTRVIGYLAEEVITTVQGLNAAIRARVVEINERIPRADGSTRWERFTTDEAHIRVLRTCWRSAESSNCTH